MDLPAAGRALPHDDVFDGALDELAVFLRDIERHLAAFEGEIVMIRDRNRPESLSPAGKDQLVGVGLPLCVCNGVAGRSVLPVGRPFVTESRTAATA